MARRVGRWAGGRITEAGGRRTFHIETMRDGARYSLSLGRVTEAQALAELALFDRDPVVYAARRKRDAAPPDDGVRVTAALVTAFAKQMRAEGLSEKYVRNTLGYLEAWVIALLAGRDIRTVKLAEMHGALDKWPTAKPKRIAALKAFTSFLRGRGELRKVDDPTADLASLQSREPTQREIASKTGTVEQLEAVYRHLDSQRHRDVFRIRATTGLHLTEIMRMAQGDCRVRRLDAGEIAGTVTIEHKSKRAHTQSVDALALAACERLIAVGTSVDIRNHDLDAALAKANEGRAKKDRLPRLMLANLRHTFVTLAGRGGREVRPPEGGVSVAMIAQLVGHTSTKMTRGRYLGDHVPPMIALPLRLFHPDDPA